MKQTVHHFPFLPNRLERLDELSYNLWFSWRSEASRLFKQMDAKLWEDVIHNPVKLLHQIDPQRIADLTKDEKFIATYDHVIHVFTQYLKNEGTWYKTSYDQAQKNQIAYFSMEFGIHESLPVYSGGLGILAGDHLKSASDLGIPLVGVGLLYREAYFTQFISQSGHQQSVYRHNDFSNMPIQPVRDEKNELVKVFVEVADRTIAARVWQVNVGRIPLYLLDTDFPENPEEDRKITQRLYVGDRDLRLIQEILLGVGGVRALEAIGHKPTVWHMNEGHCAFLAMELTRRLVNSGMSLDAAFAQIKESIVFTTHTPIAAGNEVFDANLIREYMQPVWQSITATVDQFLTLGQEVRSPDANAFNMTILSLKVSRAANGVSKLHGEVARGMWQGVFPDKTMEEVPIGSITNGVHTRTWLADEVKDLWDEYLGPDWRSQLINPDYWKAIEQIPDEAIWETHQKLRYNLLKNVRCRLISQRERNGESPESISEVKHLLSNDVLTIGFARRFAPYKRGTLLFRDRERLKWIINQADRPVQILFAGKAHPANQPGKMLIKEIYGESRNPEFGGKIVFIENYDINLARQLVAGVDVWLNTPRRPLEASGTSGMKVGMNGGLNFSILDGWWRECYNAQNGWSIGEDKLYYHEEEQDNVDSNSLYHTLEFDLAPKFYTRDEKGLPREWIKMMKASIISVTSQFNTNRMVKEYVENLYLP